MVAATAIPPDTLPCISEEAVKTALDVLLYDSCAKVRSSLENLLLVDQVLIDATFPLTPHRRGYALAHVLTSIISEELSKYRFVLGILHSEPGTSLEEAKQGIMRDKQIANPRLLGWSWLFYHYVRVDLDIGRDLFCCLAAIEQRTLLRYQHQAIRQLTVSVIEREWHVRKERHKHRLYAQLPTLTRISLYGRDNALKQVSALYSRLRPRHFQVFGERGIGKTAFVQHAVRSLIDREVIDQLIWFDTPVSTRQIQQHLKNVLSSEQGSGVSIREYMHAQRVAVVFDGLDQWGDDLAALETLLSDLGAAIVFLTACHPLPLRGVVGHIALSELPVTEAKHLIQSLLSNWYIECTEPTPQDVEAIWEQVGGNPDLITQAVFALQSQRIRTERNYYRKIAP